jgi:hypothetical protein
LNSLGNATIEAYLVLSVNSPNLIAREHYKDKKNER